MRQVDTFGDIIRNCRKSKKITQKQLGDITHIAQPLIASYETNKVAPSFKSRVKIAKALNIDLEKLCTLSELNDVLNSGGTDAVSSSSEIDVESIQENYARNLFLNLEKKGFSKNQLVGIMNIFDSSNKLEEQDLEEIIHSKKSLPYIMDDLFSNIVNMGYGITEDEYSLIMKIRELDADDQKVAISVINRLYDLLTTEMVAYNKGIEGSDVKLKISSEYGLRMSKRTF